jgi:hypothetical protein
MAMSADEGFARHDLEGGELPADELDDDVLLGHYNSSRIAALRWALGLAPGLVREEAFQVIARLWVEDDAMELGKLLADDPDAPWVEEILPYFVDYLAEKDPKQVAYWLETLGNPLAGAVVEEFAAWHARNSPEDGMRWMATLKSPTLVSTSRRRFAHEWAESSPEKALRWADGLEQNTERIGVRRAAFDGWASTDPLAASGWLEQSDFARTDSEMVKSLIHGLTGVDHPLALRWAASLGDTEARDSVLRSWMMRDAEEAWKWIGDQSFPESQLHAFREMAPATLTPVE